MRCRRATRIARWRFNYAPRLQAGSAESQLLIGRCRRECHRVRHDGTPAAFDRCGYPSRLWCVASEGFLWG